MGGFPFRQRVETPFVVKPFTSTKFFVEAAARGRFDGCSPIRESRMRGTPATNPIATHAAQPIRDATVSH